MPKINILYIITKLELGGAQKQLLDLILGLDKEKFNVFLFSAKEGWLTSQAGLVPGLIFKRSRFLERPVNPLKDFLAFFEICAYIKKQKINIIHTHSSKAGILGRLAASVCGINLVVHTVHGWSFNNYQPAFLRYFYIWLERLCARVTKKIIVVSEADRKKGLDKLIGKNGNYRLIKYGIKKEEFLVSSRSQARRFLGLDENKPAVGMVACFKPQKSPLDFINLASDLKKENICGKFILVGDGVLRNKILKSIKKLKLEKTVRLIGWRNDIASILPAFDIIVLTSLWEGLPICILEAMAAGVAVVATDTGGIAEAIENGQSGYLVRAKDREGLKNRLRELLENSEKRRKFTVLAKKRIESEEFALKRMIKDTQELYFNLWEERNYA